MTYANLPTIFVHISTFCHFKARNYSIIPCGVPMEQMIITPKHIARQQLGWSPNKKYILFGGAFSNTRKNYKLLAEAVERLKSEGMKDIECIEMKGLSRAECVLRMCACDLFALPSPSEGSPQALKEAMACNCPCLATDIADVRELFGDENCGEIIETSGREPGIGYCAIHVRRMSGGMVMNIR